MAVISNNILAGASGQTGGAAAADYQIERSLRFSEVDQNYLDRTPSASNRRTWTWSGWVKKKNGNSYFPLLATDVVANEISGTIAILNSEVYVASNNENVTVNINVRTAAKLRDPAAWYHIVVALDTTNGTQTDRVKIWINGVRQESFSASVFPGPNYEGGINRNTQHTIGRRGTAYADGYLAEVHFVDGTALTADDFGQFSPTTGVWVPKEFSGSHGPEGYHLDFSDNTSKDTLGLSATQSNGWYVYNVKTGNDGYATNLAPNKTAYTSTTLSNNNLTWNGNTTNDTGTVSSATIPTNKKTYVEVMHTTNGGGDPGPGVANGPTVEMGLDNVKAWWRGGGNGTVSNSTLGAFTGTNTTWGTSDVLGIALDHTANNGQGSITFYKNGVQAWTGGAGWTSYNDLRFEWQNNDNNTDEGTWNYGATSFSYPVSGHTGLFQPAGSEEDSLLDSPTNGDPTLDTGLGGELSGNYCTWNELNGRFSSGGIDNGLLDAVINDSSGSFVLGTLGMPENSGKWYWEITPYNGNSWQIGIARVPYPNTVRPYQSADGYIYDSQAGYKYTNSTGSPYGNSFGIDDVIGVAYDSDAGSLYFYKNGQIQNSGTVAYTNLTGTFCPVVADGNAGSTQRFHANFGQRPFTFAAPSGYKTLCTANLPDPDIADGSTAMDARLDTGNGTTQTRTFEFSPDLIWLKMRSSSGSHYLWDTVRGLGDNELRTNGSSAEGYNSAYYTISSATNGYTISQDGGGNEVNYLNNTYVTWAWDGGTGSPVSNTDGSITSSVKANTSAGFSVVTYNAGPLAPATGATVGHGLGVAPEFIVVKDRTNANPWGIYHTSLGPGVGILFNTGAASSYPTWWDNTAPTSSVFSINSDIYATAQPNDDYVAYCWAPVEGYSAFGSYQGTNNTSGPFVYLGFRPKFVLIKNASLTSAYTSWFMQDSTRNPYNPASYTTTLWANRSDLEGKRGNGDPASSFFDIDFLSNGFKIPNTGGGNHELSQSGYTYIYAAFAENPFKYARAR